MQQFTRNLLILLVAFSILASSGLAEPSPSPTPAEQFKSLRKDYDRASSSGKVLSDAERMEFIGKVYKHRNAIAQKFLELAEKNPNDPVALDALIQAVWQVNTIPWPVDLVGDDTTGGNVAGPAAF